jgi:GNAT superfamily N-acetyltransferase
MSRYLAGEHHPQQALPPRVMFIADEPGQALGYIAGHLTRRFACDAELQWIYVRRDRRGSDAAAGLLRVLARWFLERGARRVCVDVGDARAGRFYQKHGARRLDRHWMVWDDVGVVLEEGGSGNLAPEEAAPIR